MYIYMFINLVAIESDLYTIRNKKIYVRRYIILYYTYVGVFMMYNDAVILLYIYII